MEGVGMLTRKNKLRLRVSGGGEKLDKGKVAQEGGGMEKIGNGFVKTQRRVKHGGGPTKLGRVKKV